jgi:hypothetical protein
MSKLFKRISDAVLKADQVTLEQWITNIDKEVQLVEKQNKIKAKIYEALEKGVEPKKIAQITGIPVGTIYTWRKRKKQWLAMRESVKEKDYIKEAKELKQSMEQCEHG